MCPVLVELISLSLPGISVLSIIENLVFGIACKEMCLLSLHVKEATLFSVCLYNVCYYFLNVSIMSLSTETLKLKS